jgi:hypothetical protein
VSAACDPVAWGLLKERIGGDKLREAKSSLIYAARELGPVEWSNLVKRLETYLNSVSSVAGITSIADSHVSSARTISSDVDWGVYLTNTASHASRSGTVSNPLASAANDPVSFATTKARLDERLPYIIQVALDKIKPAVDTAAIRNDAFTAAFDSWSKINIEAVALDTAVRAAQSDLADEVVTKIVFALGRLTQASPCLVSAMHLCKPDEWLRLKGLLGHRWPTSPQGVVSAVRNLMNDERLLAKFKGRLGDGWQRAQDSIARCAATMLDDV